MPVQAASQAQNTSATTNVFAGDVIKGEGSSTLYYVGDDNKRHIFPNARTFNSWYDDFSAVKTVPSTTINNLSLANTNVTYRPGAKLVKLTTDPKVYAVGANGILHWIKNELLARSLYGTDWGKQVEDLPDELFPGYELGEEIDEASDYDKEQEEEAVPEIRMNLLNLRLFQPVTDASSFDGNYTITYDLSAIEVAVAGQRATVTFSELGTGQAKVGAIDLPAEVAEKIDAELSHNINMLLAERQILGVRKITITNLDKEGQPSLDGLYTQRSQNFIFGRIEAIDPPANACGALGGKLISGHFDGNTITFGKTTIGFVAGCNGVLVAARATVNWTAVKAQ